MVGGKRLREGKNKRCANFVCKEEGNSAIGTKAI